jgi:hypothetical protein
VRHYEDTFPCDITRALSRALFRGPAAKFTPAARRVARIREARGGAVFVEGGVTRHFPVLSRALFRGPAAKFTPPPLSVWWSCRGSASPLPQATAA